MNITLKITELVEEITKDLREKRRTTTKFKKT